MSRMASNLAPIALFAFRRPDHLQQVLDALVRNPEAIASDLIVFVDGPKRAKDAVLSEAVCRVVSEVSGFKSVTLHRSPVNRGLSTSITQGVTHVVQKHGAVIVIEDDIVVSSHFLEYMNTGLEIYKDNTDVASIHGYSYPVLQPLPATYFLRGADCWGWGTWARAWSAYNSNGQELLAQLITSGQGRQFDFDGSAGYTDMLRGQIQGRNDSWAVRWYASAFLRNMFTLYPGQSLVRNIGLDGSGEHCGKTSAFDSTLDEEPVNVTRIDVAESVEARVAFTEYFEAIGGTGASPVIRRLARRFSMALWRR